MDKQVINTERVEKLKKTYEDMVPFIVQIKEFWTVDLEERGKEFNKEDFERVLPHLMQDMIDNFERDVIDGLEIRATLQSEMVDEEIVLYAKHMDTVDTTFLDSRQKNLIQEGHEIVDNSQEVLEYKNLKKLNIIVAPNSAVVHMPKWDQFEEDEPIDIEVKSKIILPKSHLKGNDWLREKLEKDKKLGLKNYTYDFLDDDFVNANQGDIFVR